MPEKKPKSLAERLAAKAKDMPIIGTMVKHPFATAATGLGVGIPFIHNAAQNKIADRLLFSLLARGSDPYENAFLPLTEQQGLMPGGNLIGNPAYQDGQKLGLFDPVRASQTADFISNVKDPLLTELAHEHARFARGGRAAVTAGASPRIQSTPLAGMRQSLGNAAVNMGLPSSQVQVPGRTMIAPNVGALPEAAKEFEPIAEKVKGAKGVNELRGAIRESRQAINPTMRVLGKEINPTLTKVVRGAGKVGKWTSRAAFPLSFGLDLLEGYTASNFAEGVKNEATQAAKDKAAKDAAAQVKTDPPLSLEAAIKEANKLRDEVNKINEEYGEKVALRRYSEIVNGWLKRQHPETIKRLKAYEPARKELGL